LAAGAIAMIAIAVAPDYSSRALERDLEAATPRSINRALRHLREETRLDADERLIQLLGHEDRRTRQRVLRHVSSLNSPNAPVAILEAMKAEHFEQDDAIEAIERIRNPLSRLVIDQWLDENDEDGSVRQALAEHLERLTAEEARWGALPHTRSVIDAQISAIAELQP